MSLSLAMSAFNSSNVVRLDEEETKPADGGVQGEEGEEQRTDTIFEKPKNKNNNGKVQRRKHFGEKEKNREKGEHVKQLRAHNEHHRRAVRNTSRGPNMRTYFPLKNS